jgi:hypothetical protein
MQLNKELLDHERLKPFGISQSQIDGFTEVTNAKIARVQSLLDDAIKSEQTLNAVGSKINYIL